MVSRTETATLCWFTRGVNFHLLLSVELLKRLNGTLTFPVPK